MASSNHWHLFNFFHHFLDLIEFYLHLFCSLYFPFLNNFVCVCVYFSCGVLCDDFVDDSVIPSRTMLSCVAPNFTLDTFFKVFLYRFSIKISAALVFFVVASQNSSMILNDLKGVTWGWLKKGGLPFYLSIDNGMCV